MLKLWGRLSPINVRKVVCTAQQFEAWLFSVPMRVLRLE